MLLGVDSFILKFQSSSAFAVFLNSFAVKTVVAVIFKDVLVKM